MAKHSSKLKTFGALLYDVAMAPVAFIAALMLRYGLVGYEKTSGFWLEASAMLVPIAAGVFFLSGLHRGVWRYVSMRDLSAILRAAVLVVLIFFPLLFAYNRLEDVPRTVPFINLFVLIALLAGPRLLLRLAAEGGVGALTGRRRPLPGHVPVILVGAGRGAELFLREIDRGAAPYDPVAILDDDSGQIGRTIRGRKVVGSLADLGDVVETLGARGRRPQRVIVTRRRLEPDMLRDLLQRTQDLALPISRVPDFSALESGVTDRVTVREIDVSDLLGRPQKALDRDAMRGLISGRRVLVTGAGGSIGSELVRQIAALAPASLALLELSEFALYTIEQETGESYPELERRMYLADVRDAERVANVFADFHPEIVFHAAALKHVPLMEHNPDEAVLTNVIGTRRVADACIRHDVDVMVLVSSDKAVNPANVMGATKRLAEAYAQSQDIDQSRESGRATRFVTVRFGNVLGSTGSVVPLFQRQLAQGGPLTVTHPDITRYFMTIREAVELVLAAAAGSRLRQDDTGRIHVLDMGEPVRIQDLARMMIRLAGLTPDRDIRIEYVGLRPGEKLHEELLHSSEKLDQTDIEGVMLASPRVVERQILTRALDELAGHARARRTDRTLTLLRELVPEYKEETERQRHASS
ncbi:nucleoside-diphosphate sugar epimerase/dehydratase [Minwuia thermotolerans]|nr:nucleoside-diphosphate sugar epimerase/dehydratase [Minwuia thermotolerans]